MKYLGTSFMKRPGAGFYMAAQFQMLDSNVMICWCSLN